MANSDANYTPILPFDITIVEHFAIYDNADYHKNADACYASSIRLESGNVVKFFRYKVEKPYLIGGD